MEISNLANIDLAPILTLAKESLAGSHWAQLQVYKHKLQVGGDGMEAGETLSSGCYYM